MNLFHGLPRILFVLFCILSILMLLQACGKKQELDSHNLPVTNNDESYIELGDLPKLRQHGKLRILLPRFSTDLQYLPRSGLPIHNETELMSRFAAQVKLKPVWIYVDKFENLIPMLLQGKGDVIAANFTITKKRKRKLAFTVPVATIKEQLVTRADDQIKSMHDMVGREIAVQKATSYWDTVQKIIKRYPGIEVREIPGQYSVEEIIDAVARHKLDVTVADSNLVKALLPNLSAIKVPLTLTGEHPVAWAVRPDSVKLKAELDNFLNQERLTSTDNKHYRADLPQIKQHKVLRVLTRNNAATYFLWRGKLMGFEYELAREFARLHGLRLEMVVPPSRTALFDWLREGRGDMIAANLTIIPNQRDQDVQYSRGYNTVTEQVVTRANDNSLKTVQDLAGRSVYVRRASSYWRSLTRLIKEGIKLKLVIVPESMETEEIIDKVANGEYDLTLADSNILDIALAWRQNEIKAAFDLGGTDSHGWVVRKDQPKLLKAINAFVKKEYHGLFYNLAHEKYFQNPVEIKQRLEERVDSTQGGKLSPYDDLARKYAEQHGFDWRMIVAQMFQESRFNPRAKSWAGARGLMQIMPQTAREMGITNLRKPEQGIQAGVQYLDWLRDRFEPELRVKDRMWFALAAYNAGAGHVKDARRLAAQLGLSPNRWFGNVEKAILLLSKRKYARKAAYGYVHGIEPVKYVRQIHDRYEAYVRLAGENPLLGYKHESKESKGSDSFEIQLTSDESHGKEG